MTYKIGTYGRWEFTIKKLSYGNYKITPFEMYGEVIKTDDQVITIVDCYGIEYRILLSRLKTFEKQDKPEE